MKSAPWLLKSQDFCDRCLKYIAGRIGFPDTSDLARHAVDCGDHACRGHCTSGSKKAGNRFLGRRLVGTDPTIGIKKIALTVTGEGD